MRRRRALTVPWLTALGGSGIGCASAAGGSDIRTQWSVRSSEGLDALAFLGPLSGKPFYAAYYEAELAAFKPRLSAAALDAVANLHREADADGYLLWPQLALIFSGGADDRIDSLLASLRAQCTLRKPFEASVYWDAREWSRFSAMRPRLQQVLEGLRDAGFGEFRAAAVVPHAASRQQQLLSLLAPLDVIREQERLLGRSLQPRIEVNLLWFCRPHGVKVQGQRFLAHMMSRDQVVVLTAAHEILHPPFDMKGATAAACLAILEQDPLLARILREKNKDTGYNSLQGILDEDTVQALDQIIQERLRFGEDPSQRWTTRDQGMHVLAAGLYGLLKSDDFDRSGGNIEAWMAAAAASGRLAPRTLHPAAAAVLKRPVERLWNPGAEPGRG